MGVYVREENFLGKAPLKYDEIEIDGRDGAEIVPLGYRNFSGTLNDVVITKNNFDEVLNWLNGSGELIYMGKKTRIHFLDAYQIAKHKKTFSIPFIREPFWYKLEDEYEKPWGANLIPNGWDSFKPYGSGENYVKNWDFSTNEKLWTGSHLSAEIINGKLVMYNTTDKVNTMAYYTIGLDTDELVDVIFRVKYRSTNGFNFDNFEGGGKADNTLFEPSDTFVVREVVGQVTNGTRVKMYNGGIRNGEMGIKTEIDWIQITPVDNQHLVVEKTPLGGGLTRIQTWGGNHPNKLTLYGIYTDSNKIYTFSNFMSDKTNTLRVSVSNFGTISVGENEFIVLNGKGLNNAGIFIRIRANNMSDNLDFIASDPVIVEGGTPPTWQADENPRIINEGTIDSQPLIKLIKGTTTTCEYEVNGIYFKYHFNTDDHVIIDCEEMEATYNGMPRNRHLTIGFEFPVLRPGDNVVKQISGDATIEFKRKDRWL